MMNRSKFLTLIFATSIAITPCAQASITNTAMKVVSRHPGLATVALLGTGAFAYWSAGRVNQQVQDDIKGVKNYTFSLKGALMLAATAAGVGCAARAGLLSYIPFNELMKFAQKAALPTAGVAAGVYYIRALFGSDKKDGKKDERK